MDVLPDDIIDQFTTFTGTEPTNPEHLKHYLITEHQEWLKSTYNKWIDRLVQKSIHEFNLTKNNTEKMDKSPLLPPRVVKERLYPDQYSVLPEQVRMVARNFNFIYKVTITPQKREGTYSVRTSILAPPSFGTGVTLLHTQRLPLQLPTGTTEDLRPITYYVGGSGTQKFRVNWETNRAVYEEVVVQFE